MSRSSCPMCRTTHHRLASRRPIDALAAFPRSLARALLRTPGRALARRPARREWSVAEVLAHLLDAEVALGFRVRKIAAEPGSPIPPWDQEKWTEGLRHRRADPGQTLAAFVALRAADVALVRRLAPGQRRLSGRHPTYGRLRVEQLLDHFAEHDLVHLDQIRTTLAALRRR